MRPIDADALMESIGCADAVKYGNRDRAQQDTSYSTMMLYEIRNEIDAQPTVGGWISVKDRLPGCDDGVVLAIAEYDDGWCTVLAWRNEKTGWDTDDPLFEDGMEVTHWMPLPEPPKEDDT